MKILHISGARSWGGNEQQLINLIPELENLGAKNLVFGVDGTRLVNECKRIGAEFISAKKNKLNKFANYKYLKELISVHKPDIVHMHTSDSLTVFTVSDLLFSLKTKAIFAKKGMGASGSFLSKFKYNYKNINTIFCVSNRVKTDFSKILNEKNKHKVIVIHDCVDLNIIEEKAIFDIRKKFEIADKKIIGNIANHTAAKDLPTLIDVVFQLVNDYKRDDFVLIQIGEFSKLTPEFQQLISGKNLQKHFIFADKVDRAYSLNPQFDLFVMTSQREGGPSSVLESMLYGTTVVSTNVGVIPDVIIDGKNGFVSDVKDVKALAKTINYILDNPGIKNQIGENASLSIRDYFSAKKIAKQTFDAYQNILNS